MKEDTQPIGIVLCADKGDSIVKYTLPEDNHQMFASKYFTYLPSEEELKRELNLKEFHKKELKTEIQSGSYSKGDLQWSFGFLC